ncbi:hypothetical protein ALC53_05969 [Atta colombica]|uniref:Gustatory receptor n=1 Tax=Atta colombica TaxID=520822 RepID=A0A195BHD9_9HYME|nr:hypothetical protein ALC53_05969 [Atta colombica]
MRNSIEKALSPVFLITFFLGLGVLKYPSDQLKYRLSLFYIITLWSVYTYALYYIIDQFSIKILFQDLRNFFVIIINLLVTLISIIISICKHEKYREYIQKFNQIDDTLEELGISKEYCKMQNFTRLILIVWSVLSCMAWAYTFLVYLTEYNDIKVILVPCVLSYSLYINTITDITFALLLRYLHLELCRTARDINGYFGIQITLQMMSYFIILIEMFHFQYYMILHWKLIYKNNEALKIMIANYWWFIFYLIKLISLNYVCESISIKAQETKEVIHKLTNFNSFAELGEEIYQFALQTSLQPLKFSGLGLFYFGYDFIHKFFVWMITAVIFMAQMDFSPLWMLRIILVLQLRNFNSAQKTKEVIHKLTNFNSFAELGEEIYQFALQTSLQPLKFSGLVIFFTYFLLAQKTKEVIHKLTNFNSFAEVREEQVVFNNHTAFFSVNMNIFVMIILVSIIVRKHQKIHMCIKKLDLVDDTLEKLGIPKEYHHTINAMIIGLVLEYPFYVNSLGDIMFMFVLRYIGSRLDKINGQLLKLIPSNDMWCMIFLIKFTSLKAQKTKDLTHKLTDLVRFTEMRREIYQFLLQISLRPLEFRGMGMFHFGYKFINKVNFYDYLFYYTIYAVKIEKWYLGTYSSIINGINLLVIIISIITSLHQHKLSTYGSIPWPLQPLDLSLDFFIYQFTLRIIHHPLKLSGLGLFNFGNDFLRKVRFYIYIFIFY